MDLVSDDSLLSVVPIKQVLYTTSSSSNKGENDYLAQRSTQLVSDNIHFNQNVTQKH